MSEEAPRKPHVAKILVVVGSIAMFAGLWIFIVGLYRWLRYGGVLYDYSMATLFADVGLGYPVVSWVGAQHVIDWIMTSPAWIVLFVGSMIVVGGSLYRIDRYRSRLATYEHRQESARETEEGQPQ